MKSDKVGSEDGDTVIEGPNIQFWSPHQGGQGELRGVGLGPERQTCREGEGLQVVLVSFRVLGGHH